MDEFICEARVRFRGKELALNKIVSRIDLDEIAPERCPIDPIDYMQTLARDERRQRLADLIAAEFAHCLIQALYDAARRRD